MANIEKPKGIKESHLKYLDILQKSKKSNSSTILKKFMYNFSDFTIDESNEIIKYWVKTYNERKN